MNEEKVQVLLYTSYLHIIGGIETFIMSFIDLMADSYDIGIYCPKLPHEIANKITQKAKLFRNPYCIECDTLIMIRIMDPMPQNVLFNKSIRMCHATKSNPSWYIKDDCDTIVHVSEASKRTFGTDGEVIYNCLPKSSKRALIFVSATRIPAPDKGKNADRMMKLALMLIEADIPFLWFNFSDAPLQNAPKGFLNVGTFQDLQPYIAKADYLVQLSDQEGFGYSVLEALMNQTAVICTPFDTTKELKVIDGKNGYIVPFNMAFDVTKLLNVPKFKYTWDNDSIKAKWSSLIDRPANQTDMVSVRVISPYYDTKLEKNMSPGQFLKMKNNRAQEVAEKGFIRILGG